MQSNAPHGQQVPPGRSAAVVAWLVLVLALALVPVRLLAAPYADLVIDARTGEVLHEENADTRLHPASLTKMMTLYIAFQAIERGEISLDTKVTVSKHAASEPPSKLGLRAGQKIALRYLIRAAAIKSANDAATAIGEAIEGSEEAFAKRMNRTAKALGMSRSTFRNANGLTAEGHLSTARDMTTLGRHLFYDFPQYYNIFSRRSADAGITKVNSTNRRFLDAYEGADGIKTGYTGPAGFNLTASAQRGNKRIIATVFGGKSSASRNARIVQLLDIGFGKAPNKVNVQKPAAPDYIAQDDAADAAEADALAAAVAAAVTVSPEAPAAGKTLRLALAVTASPRPQSRPAPASATPAPSEEPAPSEDMVLAMQDTIAAALVEAQEPAGPALEQTTAPQPESLELAAIAAAEATAPDTATETAAPAGETLLTADAPEAAIAPEAVAEATEAEAPAVTVASADAAVLPLARPEQIVLASVSGPAPLQQELEVVTRVSTSGGREWGINIGSFPSRYHAERELLQTALVEMNTLGEALRKVASRGGAFDANFVGMTEESAALACRRLQARSTECTVFGP